MSRVIVALDFAELETAKSVAHELSGHVGGFKVGLELLASEGPAAVRSIVELGQPVFVDAKLHDIPNTVRRAAAQFASTGARWLTVHASGGEDMLKAAVDGFGNGVLAVSVLTSLDEGDLRDVGISHDPRELVGVLTRLAVEAGVEGAVCSPHEIDVVARGLVTFVPGVRPAGADSGDQKRVMTPMAAVEAGADFVVIGRPITASNDPKGRLDEINRSLTPLPLSSVTPDDR